MRFSGARYQAIPPALSRSLQEVPVRIYPGVQAIPAAQPARDGKDRQKSALLGFFSLWASRSAITVIGSMLSAIAIFVAMMVEIGRVPCRSFEITPVLTSKRLASS